jgi:hypothetical protein
MGFEIDSENSEFPASLLSQSAGLGAEEGRERRAGPRPGSLGPT